ncbi:ABC transporter substrate-binding protein [Bosea sp. SSUT16]|jgi:peptide/nickel transport system substrate-binding protein|uniref:ABC transporter substrate-binding protein n=1 Tax=Bosea spartocytisi TaxID=2773451 RepID=A0A927I055_9HYPH|nr:ABC transporter substrate-binding protein [Bosea spartocytisi]MBD3846176.1 ABC transporter substrate-binding protein [Bosea spartocytisi]MCT4473360.1 ABC transporter substrate-binding protein [Bosea spartocytisi]
MMRRTATATALAAALLCGGVQIAEASTLRIQLRADIRSINPGVNRDANTDGVVLQMVEGLVAYGEDALPKPLLAEKVEISPDGRSYTFTLRQGVKFHNGAPLTAADVLWSWNRYMDPKTDWRCLSEFDGRGLVKVETVTAPDDKTVMFQLDKPSALFLSSLARTDCAMTGILHKDSLKADGSFDKPIGTGPFKLGEWKRGEYIKLDRFADYASLPGKIDGMTGAKKPLVDEVRFVVIPDNATAKAALLRGDIDVVPDIANSDIAELKKNDKVKTSVITSMSLVGLIIQTRDPLLQNVKLRQAIAAAIDVKELVATITDGLGTPNNSIIPMLSAYYGAAQKEGWAYDPAAARKRLAEAGYKGEKIVMLANKRYPESFDAAVVAQQMLKAVGLNIEIEVLEWATQLDRYTKGNYQMQAFPYSGRMDPALSYESMTGPKDKQPRKLWDNPEVQALLDKSMVVNDRAGRQAIFDTLHRRFLAEVPMVMLYNGIVGGAMSAKTQGYVSTVSSLPRAWEVTVGE